MQAFVFAVPTSPAPLSAMCLAQGIKDAQFPELKSCLLLRRYDLINVVIVATNFLINHISLSFAFFSIHTYIHTYTHTHTYLLIIIALQNQRFKQNKSFARHPYNLRYLVVVLPVVILCRSNGGRSVSLFSERSRNFRSLERAASHWPIQGSGVASVTGFPLTIEH